MADKSPAPASSDSSLSDLIESCYEHAKAMWEERFEKRTAAGAGSSTR